MIWRITATLVVLLVSGCGAARMALPADVAQASEEVPITDRSSWSGALVDESFGLGSYKVTDVDRKWDSTRSSSLFGVDRSKTTGGYAFKLAGKDVALDGECATENRQKSKDLGGGWEFSSMRAKLGCACHDAGATAHLVVEASTKDRYEGTLSSGSAEYHVVAINERDGGGSSHDPTGYRVDGGEAPLGAVDVLGTGRVWLSKSLEGRSRDDLACLFAGLLLYKPPTDR